MHWAPFKARAVAGQLGLCAACCVADVPQSLLVERRDRMPGQPRIDVTGGLLAVADADGDRPLAGHLSTPANTPGLGNRSCGRGRRVQAESVRAAEAEGPRTIVSASTAS